MKGRGIQGLHRVGLLLLLGIPLAARGAAPPLDASDPIGFFTNLASRLLQSEFNLSLTRIQIYPTNQYTPAVHRLLQVSANIYEAMTNRFNDPYPHLPTVFRPRFTNDGGIVYISGYVEETNASFLSLTLRDITSPTVANAVQPDDRILGVPLIIGAKKGLPNFNEFSAETVIQITRKVELRKSAPGGGNTINETNQMFIIGISNVFGAEFWNSYLANYPWPVEIRVTNFCSLSLTNDYGFMHVSDLVASGQAAVVYWPAWRPRRPEPQPWSFLVPLRTNHIILPDSAYRLATTSFDLLTNTFERPSGFAFPRWGLTITNRVLAVLRDPGTGRIVDYVQLGRMVNHSDLSLDIAQPSIAIGFVALWATNAMGGGSSLSDQPGIIQQIEISKGNVEPGLNWQDFGMNQAGGATKYQAIANFRAFYEPSHIYVYRPSDGNTYYGTNTSLVANVPFTPTSKRSIPMIWQANDPLVHYLTSDLQFLAKSGVPIRWIPPAANANTVANLGRLNERFQPWGGNPANSQGDPNAFNVALKDPLVSSSERWNFPDSQPLSLAMLARIHRGTPWQTIYLKSTDADSLTWRNWTGNLDAKDAFDARPVRDWPLAALLTSLLNTNDPRHLVSINESNTNVWLAALDGIAAITNASTDDVLLNGEPPLFNSATMTSNSPQAAILAAAVGSARAAQANQRFNGLDALLAVPELNVTSPWLNRGSIVQLQLGISDEAYEAIPVQLLPRLRPDSVGSILPGSGTLRIQFSGFDDYPYGVESSSNLVDWVRVSTNYPVNGVFEFMVSPTAGDARWFYRSVLLP